MADRGVLLTPIYTENLKNGDRHIRAAMSTSIGYSNMIWLPVFTEWFDG
jgi:hypothetical protein